VKSYGPCWHVTALEVENPMVRRVTLVTHHGEEAQVRVPRGREPRLGDRFRVTFEPLDEETTT